MLVSAFTDFTDKEYIGNIWGVFREYIDSWFEASKGKEKKTISMRVEGIDLLDCSDKAVKNFI